MWKRGMRTLVVGWTLFATLSVLAQERGSSPQPGPEHKKLGVFVGTWKDEAEVQSGPSGPGGKMSLTETCDWFAGGFSVVCNTDTTGFIGHLKTLTILTYDAEEKFYKFHEFNSVGWNNTAKGTVDGDTWTFDGESRMGGKVVKSRTTIKLVSPDFATLKSEISVDGGPYAAFIQLKGTREKQSMTDSDSCVPHANEGWPFELFECYRKLLSSR